jgi:hypothetical protein
MNRGPLILDAGLAGGLVLALVFVYALDSFSRAEQRPDDDFKSKPQVEFKVLRAGQSGDPKAAPAPPKKLRLAVSPRRFDDLGLLLRKLGAGYDYDELGEDQLASLDRLKKYDVIFLTCAPTDHTIVSRNTALRRFVEQGGTLYVSDLRYDALRGDGAFQEYVDPAAIRPGRANQDVSAKILDPGLHEALANAPIKNEASRAAIKEGKIRLHFESPDWRPAAFVDKKVTVYLRGSYQANTGFVDDAPLLVKFACGKGSVIFTSFHNARQDEVAEHLLRYLVFRAATARVEAEMMARLTEKGDLIPSRPSLVTASNDRPEVQKKYTVQKGGRVQFALAFNEGQGAKLRLTVRSPEGKVAYHEDTASFTIEIPNAAAGEWTYTVTAVERPHENFPFSMVVAEQKTE